MARPQNSAFSCFCGYNEVRRKRYCMQKQSKNLYGARFGIKLKLIRAKHGLSRRELTEKSGLGKSYISRVEDGVILSPSQEAKQKIYEALNLDKATINFMENGAEMYFYEEDGKQNLEVSVPKSMNYGSRASKVMIEKYIDLISEENLYMLEYCAEAIYNAENPGKVEEELSDIFNEISKYDSGWRRENKTSHSKRLHQEYDEAVRKYIEEKIKNNDLILTSEELMKTIIPRVKRTLTNQKLKQLVEDGILTKEREGKKVIYKIVI